MTAFSRAGMVLAVLAALVAAPGGYGGGGLATAQPAPSLTAEQDHQQMMDRLGIRRLRPGPSGDENAPDHANYDEAKANPYPDWPDPLVMNDGRPVASAEMWRRQRRPEIVEAFEREVYGRVPADAPKVAWRPTASEVERVGPVQVTASRLIGHVDNSSDPDITVDIPMILLKPVKHSGPMPTLIMFTLGPPAFPSPVPPTPEQIARMNEALKQAMARQDPSLAEVFAGHPAWQPIPTPPFFPPPRPPGDPLQQLLADGWAVALIDPASIQPDNGAGLTHGVIGLANHGRPRKPDDWGALRAWAWGASRALDYLQTDPDIDARHIGVEGVSRYGKAALVAMAFDERFAMVLVGSSGEGGAKPNRRNFGEAVENLTAKGEYHWMAGNFLKYGAAEASFGAKTAGDLPVDSSELIALCAPRLVFISYGSPEAGDARWLDQQGSYMATVAAGKVWRLLGGKDLGVGDDYRRAIKPPTGQGLLEGQLAWRQHEGGHTDAPNVKFFIEWTDRWMGKASPYAGS
jgi:hypothetical protein